MFAALAGVLAIVGAASAQAPGQIPIPQPLPNGAARLQSTFSPAYVAGAPVTPAGAIFVKGSGGCSSCGNTAATPCQYGKTDCNNGCGSVKSTCGIIFGSCKSFFNPCGPLPSGGGWGGNGKLGGGCGSGGGGHGHGGGGHGGHCPPPPYGKPYGTGANMCTYDSFLNH
jgi:hypothetical protein